MHDPQAPFGGQPLQSPGAVATDSPGAFKLNDWGKPRLQDSSTAEMLFDVPTLVSYVSQFMTLLPGDVISTGTPAGVGQGHKPPVFLRPGDVVRYGIDGLGEAGQRVVAPTSV